MPISAELVYLFRHTVVRDAAYQLQLPSERAKLHALAFEVMDLIFGHEEPGPIVFELIEHAQAALALPGELTAERAKQISDRETELLAVAAKVALQLNQHGQAVAYLEQLLHKDISDKRKVDAYLRQSESFLKLGAVPKAEVSARSGVSLAKSAGLKIELPQALLVYAAAYLAASRHEAAMPVLEEALAQARETRNLKVQGAALGFMAVRAWRQGQTTLAEDFFAQALSALRECKDRRYLAQNLGNYGLLQADCNQNERALAVYAESYALHRDAGNDWSGAVVLYNTCLAQNSLSRNEAARETLQQARLLASRIGHARLLAAIKGRAAVFAAEDGRIDEALQLYAEAAQAARDLHDPATECSVRDNFGVLLVILGMEREAERELREAMALARNTKNELETMRCTGNYAAVLEGQSRFAESLEQANLAMELASQIGRDDSAAEFGLFKANALFVLGRLHESVVVLDAIAVHFAATSAHSSFVFLTRARMALLQGLLEESESWLARVKHKAAIVRYLSESEVQVALRLAIARGQPERAQAAFDELAAAKPDVSAWPNARHTLRLAAMRRLLAEFKERGSRRLWFGHFPEELGAAPRKALLDRATPEFLYQCDAELLAAMAAP